MLWDRIHLVPGIHILEMKLKRSQNFNYLNLTSVPQTAPAESEVNEIGATCHYLQLL